MRIQLSTSHILHNPEEVKAALLERIPEKERGNFEQPIPPNQLSFADMGVAEAEIEKAIVLLHNAKAAAQKVVIFGDYDCDGVTATALLWEALREFGITATPFLPHREKHGYGLSEKVIPDLLALHPDIIITVDNGIVAHEAIRILQQAHVVVIVTDHHEPIASLPDAQAIIHSTRLAGVSAAWILAHALLPHQADQWLDYAAIGTIADQVPLIGPSRSFAWHGLIALRNSSRPSLQALAKIANIDLSTIEASGVHFGLAPRINAMGRLTDAMEALRALVTRQPDKIAARMQVLQDTNVHRQQLTQDHLQEIASAMEPYSSDRLSIVLGNYHEGIIGLIASKLIDQYHRPSIVMSSSNDVIKASCRSVAGVHITDFLRSLPIAYSSLGGHAMAAGFSLSKELAEEFVKQAQLQALRAIDLGCCQPSLEVVGILDWSAIVPELMPVIQNFAPYGAANPDPLFQLTNVEVIDSRVVGKLNQHRQFTLRDKTSGRTLRAICFDWQRRIGDDWEGWHQAIVKLQQSQYQTSRIEAQIMATLP